MVPVLITPPAALPVSLSDMRYHLHVDGEDDDLRIMQLVAAAVGYLDGYTGILGRAIMPQTWAQEWDCVGPYTLALPDVDASALVVTADGAPVAGGDVSSKLTAAGLLVTVAGSPALPVRIEYQCALPPHLLATVAVVIKQLVQVWYDQPEEFGKLGDAPAALIAPLRRIRV